MRQQSSQRASVTFPSADRDSLKPGHKAPDPDAELNADITSLEHMHSVSELSNAEEEQLSAWTMSQTSPTLPLSTAVSHPLDTLPYLTLPYLTLPYLTLPYLTLPCLTLPYLALP